MRKFHSFVLLLTGVIASGPVVGSNNSWGINKALREDNKFMKAPDPFFNQIPGLIKEWEQKKVQLIGQIKERSRTSEEFKDAQSRSRDLLQVESIIEALHDCVKAQQSIVNDTSLPREEKDDKESYIRKQALSYLQPAHAKLKTFFQTGLTVGEWMSIQRDLKNFEERVNEQLKNPTKVTGERAAFKE